MGRISGTRISKPDNALGIGTALLTPPNLQVIVTHACRGNMYGHRLPTTVTPNSNTAHARGEHHISSHRPRNRQNWNLFPDFTNPLPRMPQIPPVLSGCSASGRYPWPGQWRTAQKQICHKAIVRPKLAGLLNCLHEKHRPGAVTVLIAEATCHVMMGFVCFLDNTEKVRRAYLMNNSSCSVLAQRIHGPGFVQFQFLAFARLLLVDQQSFVSQFFQSLDGLVRLNNSLAA